MERRSAIGLIFGFGLFGFSTLANAENLQGAQLQSTIARANSAINSLSRLQGRFIQTNPNNSTSTGQFWLSRPGKMRFQYEAPNPLLVVSDGSDVIIRDTRLRTTERYPLRSTPLYFLLKQSLNLSNEVNVVSGENSNGKTILVIRDRRREAQGELRVVFSANMELEEWAIKDRQNRITRVQLVEKRVVSAVFDRSLFIIPNSNPRGGSPKAGF